MKMDLKLAEQAFEKMKKGDLPGHEFHGNQYGDGGGGSGPSKDKAAAEARVKGFVESNKTLHSPSGATALNPNKTTYWDVINHYAENKLGHSEHDHKAISEHFKGKQSPDKVARDIQWKTDRLAGKK